MQQPNYSHLGATRGHFSYTNDSRLVLHREAAPAMTGKENDPVQKETSDQTPRSQPEGLPSTTLSQVLASIYRFFPHYRISLRGLSILGFFPPAN